MYAPPVQAPPAVAQPQQYSRLPVAVEDDRPRYLETGARPKVMLQQKSGVFDNCQVSIMVLDQSTYGYGSNCNTLEFKMSK